MTPKRTVAHHSTIAEIIPCARLMSPELVHCFDKRTARLAELNHARLKVAQRALNETVLFLVMGQEVVPERVL